MARPQRLRTREVLVGVVGSLVVVQERYRREHPGGVDQQRGVGVLAGQLLLYPGDLARVGEVSGDAPRLASAISSGARGRLSRVVVPRGARS
jgi:hypothetical protein